VILKKVRLVVSLFFFLAITFLFIDFGNSLSPKNINGILYFQFVPSIVKFLNFFSFAAAGFIFILLLTFLFGRVYCSTFCPLGTLQDIVTYFSRKFHKQKFYKTRKGIGWLQKSVLAIIIIFLLFNSMLMLNWLDPYSLFGKFASGIIRPVYYFQNNFLSFILGFIDNHTLFPVAFKSFSVYSTLFSFFVFGAIIYLSWNLSRIYCNTICPVGTSLGFVSKVSIFKIKLDESKCTSCGICGANCKTDCIDTKKKTVDFEHCVGCFNCLTVCSGNGVKFEFAIAKKKNSITNDDNEGRRKFIQNTSGALLTLAVWPYQAISERVLDPKKQVIKENPVVPPGAESIDHFTRNCTACQLCVSACPTQVLKPSFLAYGFEGIFQPTMNYNASFCNFECIICSEVCPTGAILPIQPEIKKLTQIGRSFFIKENCVVYTHETACGACSEHCPTKAVNMVFYKDKLTIPEVDNKICVGCGACEFACPTTPKSIYVDGQAIHPLAEKPVEKPAEKSTVPEEDFPF
jgi:polyferredoxin